MITATKKYGAAYAFMDLEASKEQIQEELPKAREAAQTPSGLEVYVRDMDEFLSNKSTDPDLVKCAYENAPLPIMTREQFEKGEVKGKRMSDLRYVVEVRDMDAVNNEQAAIELTNINRYLYNKFGNDEPFYSTVVLKAPDGQYCPWECEGQKYLERN